MDIGRVPLHLREGHAGWKWSVHYEYAPTVTTFRLERPDGRVRFLKLGEATVWPRVFDEGERMLWAGDHLPVPEVVEHGTDGKVDWLLTGQIPGEDATDHSLRSQPGRLVPLLAEGLRRFHSVPARDCPFDFRLDAALALARARAKAGAVITATFHEEHRDLTVGEGLAILEDERPPEDRLVVCHGDYCFPNVIVEDWTIRGFVDLGALAVADRWWDLAVASWSTVWNVGPGWEEAFIEAYGLRPEPDRIRYFRLLYEYVS